MEFSHDLLSALNEIVNDTKWQKIGTVDELLKTPCTKLYADANDDDVLVQPDDIVLFSIAHDQFYAIDCSCPHEGGPLDLGDIEDVGGELSVICPWHSYDFNLKDGSSMTGLKTTVYPVRVVESSVYIYCQHKLTLSKEPQINGTGETIEQEDAKENVQSNDNIHSLAYLSKTILNISDPMEKVALTRKFYVEIKEGLIKDVGSAIMPDQPQRKEGLDIKEPGQIKRGRGGTLQSRIALLHSLANIEQWAIDLAWDIIGRFSQYKVNDQLLPLEFYTDFVKVADDEAKHFSLINDRLIDLGSHFGALPVHNGLWQSADETSHDLLARLAIVHMVHEARGLDVHPKTMSRFSSQKDKESVSLMEVIYRDEITHVACGMKWFTYICNRSEPPLDPVETFHKLVKKHFKGYLKPPFNTDGRNIAGMDEQWYTPLIKPL